MTRCHHCPNEATHSIQLFDGEYRDVCRDCLRQYQHSEPRHG